VLWHDMCTKFHEDWRRRSSNVKHNLRNLNCSNIGITDGKLL
jgi:hypothetical protein